MILKKLLILATTLGSSFVLCSEEGAEPKSARTVAFQEGEAASFNSLPESVIGHIHIQQGGVSLRAVDTTSRNGVDEGEIIRIKGLGPDALIQAL